MMNSSLLHGLMAMLLGGSAGCSSSGSLPADENHQAASSDLEAVEHSYDDGFPEGQHSPWWEKPGGQLAVVFTPDFYPAALAKVRFLIGISGIPTTEFRVRVYGGDLFRGPDEERDLLKEEVRIRAPFGNKWVEADLTEHNILIESGEFCVAMEWITPAGDRGSRAQTIGVDYSSPDGRSWWKTDAGSKWRRIEEVANIGDRDVMIRATLQRR